MGLYRFVLAAVVVMFHCGNFPWLAGRTAVYGFYFVSGFLIARVLDRHYLASPATVVRFYLNRIIRLLPLMAAIVLLTWAVIAARGGRPFVPEDRQYLPPIMSTGTLRTGLSFVVLPPLEIRAYDGYPYIRFDMPTTIVPQSWSIGIEMVFYVIAPLLVLAGRTGAGTLAAINAIAFGLFLWGLQTTHGSFIATDGHLYENAVSSLIMFSSGVATAFAMQRITMRLRYGVMAALLLAWVVYLPLFSRMPPWSSSEPSNVPYATHILAMIPLGVVVCFTRVPDRWRRVDAFLGNLSYGIYLNHLLMGTVVLWIGERWFVAMGRPLFRTASSTGFGVLTLALSVAAAAIGFLAIEQPLERWRSRIRGVSVDAVQRDAASSPVSGALS